jgi:hypothetical protein
MTVVTSPLHKQSRYDNTVHHHFQRCRGVLLCDVGVYPPTRERGERESGSQAGVIVVVAQRLEAASQSVSHERGAEATCGLRRYNRRIGSRGICYRSPSHVRPSQLAINRLITH